MKIAQLTLKNNLILAPMAGITDLPYRRVMKEFGAALVTTEMVSANGLIHEGAKTFELMRSCAEEKPLAVQIFAGDPEALAEGASLVEPYANLIDINMGCPVKKVIRGGGGAALMQDASKIARIVKEVRRRTRLPLTVKIRSGWDSQSLNYLEVGRIAEAEGADAVTLHPRTRAQGFGGRADWDHIARLKAALSIPVIGSGDIFTAEGALRMQEQTGCDGIMIGRGGYGSPWLIRDVLARQQGAPLLPPEPSERLAVARRHLDYFIETFGENKAVFHMRKHLCWYSRALPGAATFRAAVNKTSTLPALHSLLDDFFLSAQTTKERIA